MPTATYVALANTTLGSTATDVTFSSIPSTYRDLVLIVDNLKTSSGGGENVYLNINSDTTTSNYKLLAMWGSVGGSYGSTTRTDAASIILGYNAGPNTTEALSMQINFMDYSATDKRKVVLCRSNNVGVGVGGSATDWYNTAAINSIKIEAETTSFGVGTSFALYGIEA